MNNLSKLLLEAAELLTEGAVRTNNNPQKKVTKYLKKNYDYKGNNKSGTITVRGETYNVDRDINSRTTKHPRKDDLYVTRGVGGARIDPKSSTIILGKQFADLKSNERRDAILNHEIGHKEIQHDTPKSYTNAIKRQLSNDKLKKHEIPNTTAKIKEFEPDLYASMQKNGNHLKRALRDSGNITKDDIIQYNKANRQLTIKNLPEYKKINEKYNKILKDMPVHGEHGSDERKKIIEARKKIIKERQNEIHKAYIKYNDEDLTSRKMEAKNNGISDENIKKMTSIEDDYKKSLTNKKLTENHKKINANLKTVIDRRTKVLKDKSIDKQIYSK